MTEKEREMEYRKTKVSAALVGLIAIFVVTLLDI